MWMCLLHLQASATNKRELLEILARVRGPTLAQPGCIGCSIYDELGDEHAILYREAWNSWTDLKFHIESNVFNKLLAAMDLAASEPDVQFMEIGSLQGMDLIRSIRGHSSI